MLFSVASFRTRGVTYGALLEPERRAGSAAGAGSGSVRRGWRLRGRRRAGQAARQSRCRCRRRCGCGAAVPIRASSPPTETVTSSSAVMLISVPRPATGSRCRPCRWKPRRGARPRRPRRRPSSPASDRAFGDGLAEFGHQHRLRVSRRTRCTCGPRRWRLSSGGGVACGSGVVLFWFWCCLPGGGFAVARAALGTLRRVAMTASSPRSRRCRLHGRRSWSALPLRAKESPCRPCRWNTSSKGSSSSTVSPSA